MSPEEFSKIEQLIKGVNKKNWIIYLLTFLIGLFVSFVSEFALTKGQGYATKQDIGVITDTIESIKSKILTNQDIEKQKRELKYNALLKSLKLIDCYVSNHWKSSKDTIIDKQYATIEEYRDCQNQLILTCNDSEIINKFYEMIFSKDKKLGNEMKLLSEYRQMVRNELSFGQILNLDTNKVWITHIISNHN